MPQPENHEQKEFLAQTKLDEAVYALLELGWTEDDIMDKVSDLASNFEGGDE